MSAKRLMIPLVLLGLIILGSQAHGLFFRDGDETSLDSIQIEAQADASTKTDLLILVNKDNKLPSDYKINLTTIGDVKVSSALVNDLREMRDAAEKDSVTLYIDNAYRTSAEQEQTFKDTVSEYNQRAQTETNKQRANNAAALPGYSEHETGLAIDFSFEGNAKRQADMWSWLSENAYKYGFILRYPDGKRPITGYKYEPWHYRYVGKVHARTIFERGLTLEEYIADKE